MDGSGLGRRFSQVTFLDELLDVCEAFGGRVQRNGESAAILGDHLRLGQEPRRLRAESGTLEFLPELGKHRPSSREVECLVRLLRLLD